MSIIKVQRKRHGVGWTVRYTDDQGVKRSRTFDRKSDALNHEAEARRLKQNGELSNLDAGKVKLGEFALTWWDRWAVRMLSDASQETYQAQLRLRILPRWENVRLRAIDPGDIEDWTAELSAEGVGGETIKKTITVFQSLLRYAVKKKFLSANPVREATKPRSCRNREVSTLTPRQIERIRADLKAGPNGLRNATLVSVMAYAGLRPAEALALRWEDLRERSIRVEQAVAFGEIKPTKTEELRFVSYFEALKADLNEWRLASGGRSGLIFPATDGKPWNQNAYKSWARRTFAHAAIRSIGFRETPYTLRHSFASLLIHAGKRVPEVADELGNSPTITLEHYAGFFKESVAGATVDEIISNARCEQDDGRGSTAQAA